MDHFYLTSSEQPLTFTMLEDAAVRRQFFDWYQRHLLCGNHDKRVLVTRTWATYGLSDPGSCYQVDAVSLNRTKLYLATSCN